MKVMALMGEWLVLDETVRGMYGMRSASTSVIERLDAVEWEMDVDWDTYEVYEQAADWSLEQRREYEL